jgi:hypothetical protein
VQSEVDAFVAEQEAKFGGEPGTQRENYELLQLFDRLSLYFCLREGDEAEFQGYRLEPVAPWHVKIAPFPFTSSPGQFSLVRRVIPKSGAADVLAAEPHVTAITIAA